jgi:predicted transglutaminase-like cysteine proteinase
MRSMAIATLCGFIVGGIGFAGSAHADQWMRIGAQTSIPYGHMIYCQSHPGNCAAHGVAGPRALSAGEWQKVETINLSVNRMLSPRSDMDSHGEQDVWTYARTHGDCEDYALHKRARLIAAGFHPSSVLLTMVRLPHGEAHIVTALRTADGDFVLDNMRDAIVPWRSTGYRFLKVQSPDHAGRWRGINGGTRRLTS